MPQTKALQLPFTGSWFCFWGGDSKELNNHHGNITENYALDLLIMDKNGATHRGDGSKNTDYYAYSQDIVAVAAGIVVQAVDGIVENEPQKTSNTHMFSGNSVIIKHGQEVFAVYAHLKTSSVKVKIGDRVKAGQVIGQCGNSGNSTEPHLHFDLRDSLPISRINKDYTKTVTAKSIKPYFEVKVTRDSQSREDSHYSPIKGDTLSPLG
ncbi:MAG TPA: M23 family metallopeptidase [Candidatus Saccharimonadales bacterium]